MNKNYEKLVSLSTAAIGIALIFVSASSALAQTGLTRPLTTERERQQRQMDQRYREPDTGFRRAKYSLPESERRPISPALIKGHAARIQFINERMMRLVSPETKLDYKAIAKAAGEIRKYAVELRLYLGLPKLDETGKSRQAWDKLDGKEVSASLLKLDSVVRSFGANPLLNSQSVLDAGQATRAGRDLEDIIDLGDKIRKSAKKLSRAVRGSR
jgi:hypothetical protein